jgi:hypothetical protein
MPLFLGSKLERDDALFIFEPFWILELVSHPSLIIAAEIHVVGFKPAGCIDQMDNLEEEMVSYLSRDLCQGVAFH